MNKTCSNCKHGYVESGEDFPGAHEVTCYQACRLANEPVDPAGCCDKWEVRG